MCTREFVDSSDASPVETSHGLAFLQWSARTAARLWPKHCPMACELWAMSKFLWFSSDLSLSLSQSHYSDWFKNKIGGCHARVWGSAGMMYSQNYLMSSSNHVVLTEAIGGIHWKTTFPRQKASRITRARATLESCLLIITVLERAMPKLSHHLLLILLTISNNNESWILQPPGELEGYLTSKNKNYQAFGNLHDKPEWSQNELKTKTCSKTWSRDMSWGHKKSRASFAHRNNLDIRSLALVQYLKAQSECHAFWRLRLEPLQKTMQLGQERWSLQWSILQIVKGFICLSDYVDCPHVDALMTPNSVAEWLSTKGRTQRWASADSKLGTFDSTDFDLTISANSRNQ